MKLRLTMVFLLVAGPAAADPGHIANVAGHSHWVAGIALVAAGAIALAGLIKAGLDASQSEQDEAEAAPDTDDQPQEG